MLDALLIQDDRRLKVKQVVPGPAERDRVLLSFDRDGDEPECFGYEGLDLEVAFDDEAEGWELTGTCNRTKWAGARSVDYVSPQPSRKRDRKATDHS